LHDGVLELALARAEVAEARVRHLEGVLAHFAAEAHRRKWAFEGIPEAFDALDQFGNEMLAASKREAAGG
jgi:C4-type Zn-finger protein